MKVTIYSDSSRFMLVNEAGQMVEDGFRSQRAATKYATDNNMILVLTFHLKTTRQ